mmetsp:Transcript_74959/g.210354  ORF Transcript_74959/g.210354 Transcript_74959/m.210354 type:complete len:258 (+) Transcript_74959:322-1095(+)
MEVQPAHADVAGQVDALHNRPRLHPLVGEEAGLEHARQEADQAVPALVPRVRKVHEVCPWDCQVCAPATGPGAVEERRALTARQREAHATLAASTRPADAGRVADLVAEARRRALLRAGVGDQLARALRLLCHGQLRPADVLGVHGELEPLGDRGEALRHGHVRSGIRVVLRPPGGGFSLKSIQGASAVEVDATCALVVGEGRVRGARRPYERGRCHEQHGDERAAEGTGHFARGLWLSIQNAADKRKGCRAAGAQT